MRTANFGGPIKKFLAITKHGVPDKAYAGILTSGCVANLHNNPGTVPIFMGQRSEG